MAGDLMEEALKRWLDEKLPEFLTSVNLDIFDEGDRWEMPVVEDYCLVVGVKDFKDGQGGVFCIFPSGTPVYRIAGLLGEAINDL